MDFLSALPIIIYIDYARFILFSLIFFFKSAYNLRSCTFGNPCCRGKVPRTYNGPWAHIEFDHIRGEGVDTKRAPGPILMGPSLFKRRSEEKCLLGRAKYGSNTPPASNKYSPQQVLVARMNPTSP